MSSVEVSQSKRMYRLAGLVSEGMSIAGAGRAMGLTRGQVNGLWTRIREGLGKQAQ